MLGHSSAAMTLDLYADLFDDDLDPVAAALEAAKRAAGDVNVLSRDVGSVVRMWLRERDRESE